MLRTSSPGLMGVDVHRRDLSQPHPGQGHGRGHRVQLGTPPPIASATFLAVMNAMKSTRQVGMGSRAGAASRPCHPDSARPDVMTGTGGLLTPLDDVADAIIPG